MNIKSHIINASGFLSTLESILKTRTEEVIQEITQKIPLDNVDIVIFDQRDDFSNNAQVDPKTGLGQFATSSSVVYIAVDATHNDIYKEITGTTFLAVCSHALYHCLRGKTLSIYGHRPHLLEGIIGEGLAGHFEEEMTNTFVPEMYHSVKGDELEAFRKRAEKEYYDEKYSYSKWFLGAEPTIPYGAGHSLGYQLVADYLAAHPTEKVSYLYNKPPREFIYM